MALEQAENRDRGICVMDAEMNAVEAKIWSDGTRHWYDAPLSGYYMDEGRAGLFNDSGTIVRGFENAVAHSRDEFVSLVKAIVLASPGILI
jgi:hypothetical protein